VGEKIVGISAAVAEIPHLGPHDLINGLIAGFDAHRPRLEEAASRGKRIPLASVRLRAPLPRPINIDCMAVNYMEDGTRKEPAPINAFHKSPSAIIGPGETMVLPDAPASVFEGEAELGVAWLTSFRAVSSGQAPCTRWCPATSSPAAPTTAFQDGDRIELEIDNLGRLAFNVSDVLKRTWSRETRLERQEKGLDPVAPQLSGKYAAA
jgi:2-keto-4-pentenoate hydratase/2-oxohepta-3-ene-1,7-dioic acid hydratase in catechol pathway